MAIVNRSPEMVELCARYNLLSDSCTQQNVDLERLKERCRKVGIFTMENCNNKHITEIEDNLPKRCEFYKLSDENIINYLKQTLNDRYRLYIQDNKRHLIMEPSKNIETLKFQYEIETDTNKKKEIENEYVNKKMNEITKYLSCTKENADFIAKKCTNYQISAITGLPCNIVSVFDTLDKCYSLGISEKDCNIYLLEEMKRNEEFQKIIDLADDTINENIRVLTSERNLVNREFEIRKQNFEKFSASMEEIQRKLFSEATQKITKANQEVEERISELKRQKRLEFISDIKDKFIYIIVGFLILIMIFVIS
jgi:hypothetical protein